MRDNSDYFEVLAEYAKKTDTIIRILDKHTERFEAIEKQQETTNKILLDVAKVVGNLVDRAERTELIQIEMQKGQAETNKLLRELIGEVREVKERYNSLEARIERIEKVVFKAS